jgi:hypothetical protein
VSGHTFTTADRVRHALAQYLPVAVGVCLLLAAAGGALAVTGFDGPETTTEERIVGAWETDDAFIHNATVVNETGAFEEGAVLENRSLYFTRASPVLRGAYVYRHRGDVAPATVTTRLQLIKRAVGTADGDQVTYWQVSEPLANRTATVEPGDSLRTSFSVNTTAQFREIERIRLDLGSTVGRPELFVLARTEAQTTMAGEPISDQRRGSLVLEGRAGSYLVSENVSGTNLSERTETVTVPVESSPLPGIAGILLALLGVGGAVVLISAARRDRLRLPPARRRELERQRIRAEFEEWISSGEVPPAGPGDRVVTMDSLEDLVDVAIDTDRRVIDDGGRYVVIDGATRYAFTQPTGHGSIGDRAGSSTAQDTLSGPDDGADETGDEAT